MLGSEYTLVKWTHVVFSNFSLSIFCNYKNVFYPLQSTLLQSRIPSGVVQIYVVGLSQPKKTCWSRQKWVGTCIGNIGLENIYNFIASWNIRVSSQHWHDVSHQQRSDGSFDRVFWLKIKYIQVSRYWPFVTSLTKGRSCGNRVYIETSIHQSN